MKKPITVFAVLTLLASACSLKEDMRGYARYDAYYTTLQQCETGVNACYNLIRSQLSGTGFWEATECTTDLMFLNLSTQYNATLDISPTKPAIASTIWQYSYMGVMRANGMLATMDRNIQKGNYSEADALPYKGELVVLRAFFYYLLTSTFGDVPYYTCEVTEDNRAEIARLPRMSANDTRNALIEELKHYLYPTTAGGLGALPLKRAYDEPFENRLGAAAGLLIAGKFCLWNHRWEDAVEVLEVLEGIYGEFASNPEGFGKRYPLTDVPFGNKYTKESIFEISNAFEEYGIQTTGNLALFTTPGKGSKLISYEDEEEFTVSDVYNGIGIPELGAYSRVSVSARPTTYYYNTVLPYYSPDLRSGEYSAGSEVARGGSGNLAWRWSGFAESDTDRLPEDRAARWFTSCNKANSRPWLGNKFWSFGMYYSADNNNYKIFRYADALLMLAEAHLNAGHPDKAASYLNITRTRAGLDKISLDYVGGSSEAFMEEIRLERARELFGEYQRKFDLVRWGIWYERTKTYNDGMYLPGFIRPYHEYLPIPAEQITYSGGALDNHAYGQ